MKAKNKIQNSEYANIKSRRDQSYQKGVKPIIGIDIGSSNIKIVQMKKGNRVARYGMETIPVGMINQGRIETPAQLTEVIKKTMSKYKISGGECALCLSAHELVVRELKLPEMSESQIIDNIKHEITSFLPLSHEEYCIDYKVLEYVKTQENTPGTLRIMVAAVPNNLVAPYIDTLKKANLKVSYVDVIPNIAGKLAKWLIMNSSGSGNIDICIIDIGAHTTNIVIVKDGNYFIHKTIINGSEYITSIIEDKMNLDFIEAEEYKINNNFFNDSISNSASPHVINFIDYLIMDIERILEFYRSRNNQKGVDQIYLMGGGSLLKGLPQYMAEHTGIRTTLLSEALPLMNNYDSGAHPSVFYNAIGATMREEC